MDAPVRTRSNLGAGQRKLASSSIDIQKLTPPLTPPLIPSKTKWDSRQFSVLNNWLRNVFHAESIKHYIPESIKHYIPESLHS